MAPFRNGGPSEWRADTGLFNLSTDYFLVWMYGFVLPENILGMFPGENVPGNCRKCPRPSEGTYLSVNLPELHTSAYRTLNKHEKKTKKHIRRMSLGDYLLHKTINCLFCVKIRCCNLQRNKLLFYLPFMLIQCITSRSM